MKPEDEASALALTKAIDDSLDKGTVKKWRKITGFHPSSVTNNCRRYWFMLFEGAESERVIAPRTQRIFDNGHAVHEMGILIDDEVELTIKEPIPLRGYIDGIIDWGGPALYELKSISPVRFEFRKMYRKPDEKALRQLMLYLWAQDIKRGFVIYEDKGTQTVLIFPVEYDEVAAMKEIKRLKGIYKNVEENTLPKRPYKRDSQQCGDCELLKWCWDVKPD
jgi:CRISPR/Cas system-associated exonuclease Cas4 (RecB family)